ncbi:DNA-directed RNA polymerase subunit beta [Candidatus Sumerlaeota bacterium]|nr:DNA-directed RNA polymerase subunit beta [Candidatus Sumerlaeota bacterium]
MPQNNGAHSRHTFARITDAMEMPYLLETQKESYRIFLQDETPADEREDIGLQEAFKSIFPISTHGNPSTLEFVDYSFGLPKYSVKECIERGMTFAAPLKVKLQLIVRETDEETGETEIKDIKEQECYMGEIPLMTDNGTFIINGAERVVVSQLHRSPGVSFASAIHPNGKPTYSARIIPYRGAWVEFEIDIYNVCSVMIDRKRKIPVTTFLRAFGFELDEEIAAAFFNRESITLKNIGRGETKIGDLEKYLGEEFMEDIFDAKGQKRLVEKGAKVTKKVIELLKNNKIKDALLSASESYSSMLGRILGADVIDWETGEVLGECWDRITTDFLRMAVDAGIKEIVALEVDEEETDIILSTLSKDKVKTYEEALVEIFKRLRPGNPVSVQSGKRLLEEMFFSEKRYDLGNVGRYKINRRFKREPDETPDRILYLQDIVDVVGHLIRLAKEQVDVDDIDHLGNRRVRSVGELLQNQIRMGLAEMEKTARDRMAIVDLENLLPHNLINAKPVATAIKDFFGRSQLSQFMDQTNPLSELTHKRRLSALGPGGLSRDRAGFEVRDVHHSHYGRICPIETPEGPNIGLISSLSTFARINEYGFIETPYVRCDNATVTGDIEYLTADVEDEYTIAQANAPVENKKFRNPLVFVRKAGDFQQIDRKIPQYMDISPKQLVSVSAALIPFLEHDDANRALMGSNMQRQAVPLIFTNAPYVGTGMEFKAAQDSGVCVIAPADGTVEYSTSNEIRVKRSRSDQADVFKLLKFKRSNQNTCINQKPLVTLGEKVRKGQVLADGPACEQGELALGRNVLVAFMPWGGYNYEDAILISENLVKHDVFTSIHIEEFEIDARDTKLGKEEITQDIPNVSEEALAKLDEDGIVYIGAEIKPGDILVGKVSPKGETELTSEEKLLRAIFGEKAGDVRDASLKVPPGVQGIVVDTKVFSRKERAGRTDREDKKRIGDIEAERDEALKLIEADFSAGLKEILQELDREIINFETGKVEMKPGSRVTEANIEFMKRTLRTGMLPVDGKIGARIKQLFQETSRRERDVVETSKNKIDRIKTGDELPPGVNKMVKVYVATKRKLSVGDKMAGRHGNKGVISKVLPVEDMPYLADGTPVDICLNPLGVPSRMNVGQILETHLGWAAHFLNMRYATPVFDGAKEWEIRDFLVRGREEKDGTPYEEMLRKDRRKGEKKSPYECYETDVKQKKLSNEERINWFISRTREDWDISSLFKTINHTGQAHLYDGLTGNRFDNPVTVGFIYMLKLDHLVDDKMHARSIGPYSLVTQQPLGGKAQFGGQRFGEMEVWALEAYGAAHTLQEMLTVKSDDIQGRTKIYESIVKGENTLDAGIPESFNVLVKELQSLGLNLELLTAKQLQAEEDAAKEEEEISFDTFISPDEEDIFEMDEEFVEDEI